MQSSRGEDAHGRNTAAEVAAVHSQREAGPQQEIPTDREGDVKGIYMRITINATHHM